METQPDDMLFHQFSFLKYKDILKVGQVCKRLRQLSQSTRFDKLVEQANERRREEAIGYILNVFFGSSHIMANFEGEHPGSISTKNRLIYRYVGDGNDPRVRKISVTEGMEYISDVIRNGECFTAAFDRDTDMGEILGLPTVTIADEAISQHRRMTVITGHFGYMVDKLLLI